MERDSIYQAQGLGREMRIGDSFALLIVDFVNGFLDPEIFGGGTCAEAAARTVPVLAAARAAGIPVVFTRIVYADDGADRGVWCEKVPKLATLTERAASSQVADILAPASGEYVLRKKQASAFFGTDLAAYLVGKGIDTILIAGATTSGCVRASVVDAVGYNFRPLVIRDCVGDRASDPHEANLFDMEQKYAELIDAEAAIRLVRSL